MFTPEEIETHIETAMSQLDQDWTERAAVRAQIAQAEALTVIAHQLARLVELVEMTIDQKDGCFVTRPAEF
jgi:hypothetical protein